MAAAYAAVAPLGNYAKNHILVIRFSFNYAT